MIEMIAKDENGIIIKLHDMVKYTDPRNRHMLIGEVLKIKDQSQAHVYCYGTLIYIYCFYFKGWINVNMITVLSEEDLEYYFG